VEVWPNRAQNNITAITCSEVVGKLTAYLNGIWLAGPEMKSRRFAPSGLM
jgi:hypothetical protein